VKEKINSLTSQMLLIIISLNTCLLLITKYMKRWSVDKNSTVLYMYFRAVDMCYIIKTL